MGNGPGAHGAGLQRDPEIAPLKPVIATLRHRRLQRQHFGMVQTVPVPPHPVLRQRDDVALGVGHRGGHRHFAGRRRRGGLLQQKSHDVGALR